MRITLNNKASPLQIIKRGLLREPLPVACDFHLEAYITRAAWLENSHGTGLLRGRQLRSDLRLPLAEPQYGDTASQAKE